jgi:hypothetical protein
MTARLSAPQLGFCAANTFPTSVISNTANTVSLKGVRVDTINRYQNRIPFNVDNNLGIAGFNMDRRFLDWFIRREKGPDADTEALHKLKLGPQYVGTSLITTMCRTRILDTVNFSTCYIKADDTVDAVYLRGHNSKDFSKLDISTYYANRNFFETEQGYFGLGPCWLDRDDLIVLLDGGTTPFILRNVEAEDGKAGDT